MRNAAAWIAATSCALAACAQAAGPTARLQETYWKLLQLGGDKVSVEEGQREPHMVVHGASRQLDAFGGCNQLTATFVQDGASLTLTSARVTVAGCRNPALMRTEQRFFEALPRTARWRISGEQLELLDAGGTPVARFEAVYLR